MGRDDTRIQYLHDADGNTTAVLVPIDVWKGMVEEDETAYLLSSPAMKQRLIEAKDSDQWVELEAAKAKLGL